MGSPNEDRLHLLSLPGQPHPGRHEHRVRQFSDDYALLTRLQCLATDRTGATQLIDHVCRLQSVVPPVVTFHGRRGPHTGYCMAPRWLTLRRLGEESLGGWERRHGRGWPDAGMIRLGTQPSLGTIAHELGHHLVNHRESPRAPAHGKLWVAHFDTAARSIAGVIDHRSP